MTDILKELMEAEEEIMVMKSIAEKNPETQHLYWAGELIKINLDKFSVVEIDDSATLHSNYYLVMSVDGRNYRVSELVANVFTALICWAKDSNMNIKGCAETALKLFIASYERIESYSTKDEIVKQLGIILTLCIRTVIEANIVRKQGKKSKRK